jgi:hypothetical protein
VPGELTSIIYFVVFSQKTAFLKLESIFPECFFYRDQSPQIDPLMCLLEDNACTVGKNCIETIVKRLHVLFQEILPGVNVIVLYYKKRGGTGVGAGIFWKDMREPRVITVNPFAWQKIKQRGAVYQFQPNSSFFLTGQASPPEIEKNTDHL